MRTKVVTTWLGMVAGSYNDGSTLKDLFRSALESGFTVAHLLVMQLLEPYSLTLVKDKTRGALQRHWIYCLS
jgi:hypothetical protein